MPTQAKTNIVYAPIRELRLVILCHGRHNPRDYEWAPYIRLLRDVLGDDTNARVLVITDGGHPSRDQQALMKSSLPGRGTRVAVISPSVVARFITSILVMTNPGIRCFSPQQRHQAYVHLGLEASQIHQVDTLTKELSQRLSMASAQADRCSA